MKIKPSKLSIDIRELARTTAMRIADELDNREYDEKLVHEKLRTLVTILSEGKKERGEFDVR